MDFSTCAIASRDFSFYCSLPPCSRGCLERGQPTMVESGGDDDGVSANSLPASQKLS
jgi:hypothetical protein